METNESFLQVVAKKPLVQLAFAGAIGSTLSTVIMRTYRGEKGVAGEWVLWAMMVAVFAAVTNQPIFKKRYQLKPTPQA